MNRLRTNSRSAIIGDRIQIYRRRAVVKACISVLVACYNNQKYIYECLRSIFSQTYPNIEILIGDDCSENFDGQALIEWINKCRTPNISRIVVNRNEKNLGTVANLEQLQMRSTGEFLFNIAADDILFDDHVLERMIAKTVDNRETVELVVAETEMWDHELKKCIGHFITPEIAATIERSTARDLFALCAEKIILPASFLYRKSMLDKVGKLSDTYRLVEDWPTHLRVLASGTKPIYMSDSPSIKHRDGGISHGNNIQSKRTFLIYYSDILKLYNNEVVPHLDLLSDKEKKSVKTLYEDRIRAYYKIHVPAYYKACEENINAAIQELKDYERAGKLPPTQETSAEGALYLAEKWRMRERIKNIAFCFSRKKVVLSAAAFALVCFLIFYGLRKMNTSQPGIVGMILLIAAVLSALFSFGAAAVNVLLRIRRKRHGG